MRLTTTTHRGIDTEPLLLHDSALSPAVRAMVERDHDYCMRMAFGGCHYRILPDDLVAEANLFMVYIAQRWEADRGTQFVTYFADSWKARMGNLFRGRVKRLAVRQFALADHDARTGEEESVTSRDLTPLAEMERAETLDTIRQVMRELPETDRQACEMHFGEGKRFSEIARETGRGHEVTRQAVRRFVEKAKKRMGVWSEP